MKNPDSAEYKKLNKILYCGTPHDIFAEIVQVIGLISPDFDPAFLTTTFADIVRLFAGDYPGFQASKTKFHNLPHTCWVALAVTRLIHAHSLEGVIFSDRAIELGVMTALFHDTGLIQEDEEKGGTGAKFTIGHETRSINFLHEYLRSKGKEDICGSDCEAIIRCTILALPPSEITFQSEEMKLIGYILGSADLLAQMAERTYLEKLPLLFEEFKEGSVPGFESSFDLFQKTDTFYREIVKKRLDNAMDGVSRNIRKHFQARWDMDRDLYAESIDKQITYLKHITESCAGDYGLLLKNLKRGGELHGRGYD